MIQYVDPGTGSLLTQLCFSLVIGVGFYLISMRRRIKSLFQGRSLEPQASQDGEKSEPRQPNRV
jgi:hypothetical protein